MRVRNDIRQELVTVSLREAGDYPGLVTVHSNLICFVCSSDRSLPSRSNVRRTFL